MSKVAEQPARLKITEIFYSLQGEARNVGLPTVFVRLTGCPLRCSYCDTAYAFSGGEWIAMASIIDEIKRYKPHTSLSPAANRWRRKIVLIF